MYLIFLANLLVSILSPWIHPSLASSASPGGGGQPERDAAAAEQQPTAAAAVASDNTTRHHGLEHAVTYPSRLIYYLNEDSESTYHDLDTRLKVPAAHGPAVHLAEASFQLEAFGSRFVLDLTLNNELLSSDYVEIHFEKGKPVQSKVRGNDKSHAALSTCNGLHGMFDDGVFTYVIEPLQQTHPIDTAARPHTLHRALSHRWSGDPAASGVVEEEEAGGEEAEGEEAEGEETEAGLMEREAEDVLSELDDLSWLKRRKKRAMPRNIFEEMKYLEVIIVSDHSMYKGCKNKQRTKNFAKSVVNVVDAIFKEHLHTRVVLVAVEIWTDKDQIPISVKPLEMLRDFSKYRQQSIKLHADAVHLFSNVTFHYRRSGVSYFGGMCSYGSTWSMALSLAQSLAQNLGIQWDPVAKRKECGCESWPGCIMEDTGVQHTRKFSKCSLNDYKEFLLKGGGSCLFNRPTKLFEATECGNGFVEVGEECDCGSRPECYKECCKKCSLANGAHCSDGPCCNNTCLTCSGDSGQCPPNLHKQDGYFCHLNQGRCYSGECKTRESQCKYIWGSKAAGSEKFCYEKLNTEGTEKGNCGKDGEKWTPCSKHDVFCGYLLCSNIGQNPRIGALKGEVTPTSFNHQGRVVDCSGGHVLLDDETDLGYVEDGAPCGPSMMCLDHKCLPIQSLNVSTCPVGPNAQVCSAHGVCNNEATCTCDTTWAGTDCSMPDPPKEPEATEDEGPKGPSATNLIIGSIAGAILVAAIVLGGTGWGFNRTSNKMAG
ncbi:hypothetical protein NHX12_007767 [Muraenolepis orangiensis]|uniref:Disintegrin and metalloproteinase domain-containing protein 23 n=1 Tax=Muraenolepis orangiensis TaxID=630683 RepID=A0A9Q0DT25_9TELE|nr:hypothetical protein NHX12_007767 [Muraenolepis orangiensis]